jgi:hypothetical protein
MDAARALLCVLLGAGALPAASSAAGPLAPPVFRPGLRPASTLTPSYLPEESYSLALHIHGSMSEQYGSMEWHTAKAESLGVDIIWWSDHDWRLSNWRYLNKYNFETAEWNGSRTRWSEVDDAWTANHRYWQTDLPSMSIVQSSISDTLAFEGARSLVLETTGQPDTSFASGYLRQSTEMINNRYSLAKRVTLMFALYPEAIDLQDSRFVFQVELSDHPEGTKILRYIVGSMAGEGPHSTALAFTPGEWNEYTIDVTGDAIQHFSTGGIDTLRAEDNTLGMVWIGLETRNGAPARVLFDGYRIVPDSSLVDTALLNRARAMEDYYESLYPGVTHFTGTEISKYAAWPHLNGFAPNLQLVDYTGYAWTDSLWYAVDQIHAQNGAVSLNHVFGTGFNYIWDPYETPEERAARLLFTKRQMIPIRAWRTEILEVGYRRRAGMDLVHHLDIWDALVGNAIWLTGDGVTDSHGRGEHNLIGWGPDSTLATTNNFVTWLATESFSEAGFVQALKRGRAWFGDPYRWQGALDLTTLDGFRMGQVVFTDRDEHELAVEVGSVPTDVQVRLLQMEIRENPPEEYTTMNVLRDEILAGVVANDTFTDTLTVDTSLPSFLRIEVYDGTGEEMVFSNPIHFVRAAPLLGIPAERVGVRIGEIRIFLAEEFTLTDAAFDSTSRILTVTGHEETSGLGTLTIDPGALGEPVAVSGAADWTWAAGTLTLSGFSGTGSVIQVAWAPTALPEPAGRGAGDLWLGPGRPNPFEAGTLAEYVLPGEGPVRLEIFDVAGRRIRVLKTGVRREGRHRVAWDGLDEAGETAASGIYWLRLSFHGDDRVRKVVKIRTR